MSHAVFSVDVRVGKGATDVAESVKFGIYGPSARYNALLIHVKFRMEERTISLPSSVKFLPD